MCRSILFFFISLVFATISIAQSNPTDSTKTDMVVDDKTVFEKVDKQAEFFEGNAAWTRYIQLNLNYFVAMENKAPSGKYKIIVRFIVTKKGKVKEITPQTAYGYGMEKEVSRVIKGSAKWTPALINGKAVNSYKLQPVTFGVE